MGCDRDMKRRAGTGTKDRVLRPDEYAQGLTAAATGALSFRRTKDDGPKSPGIVAETTCGD